MTEYINADLKEVQKICGDLLSDCILDIKFDHYPLSVNLDFISNIKTQRVQFKCQNLSQLILEKNPDDDSFYTVFEVIAKHEDGNWLIKILPEVDLIIKCASLKVNVVDLTEEEINQ